MTVAAAERILAASPSPQPLDPSKVEPGLLGLAFFVVMALVLVLLILSMRKRLANIDVDRHQRERAERAGRASDGHREQQARGETAARDGEADRGGPQP